jgi:DNA-binding MarR family transcriptional regulator
MALTPRPLSEKHRAVLQFLVAFRKRENCSPTYREIREGLDIAQGQVQSAIRKLEERGLITKPVLTRGKAGAGRHLRVTVLGEAEAEMG